MVLNLLFAIYFELSKIPLQAEIWLQTKSIQIMLLFACSFTTSTIERIAQHLFTS